MNKVESILALTGPAILLPIPRGQKRPDFIGWQNTTPEQMREPEYLARLNNGGNVGVLQGKPSNGLCSIDLDDHKWVEAFLADNPRLRATLRTKRLRGCNLWVRIVGDCPPLKLLVHPRLKNPKGKPLDVGEWRSTGGQTVIAGEAGGLPYQIEVERETIEIPFAEIVWPDFIANPPTIGEAKTKKSSPPILPATNGDNYPGDGLDFSKLENMKHLAGGSVRAACPACREQGGDNTGEHLHIDSAGKFGCAKFQGDAEHRRAIWRLAGKYDASNHFRNDIGYADAFVKRHADSIRYCADEAAWLVFTDATGWQRDESGEIKSMAADFARELYRQALVRAATMDPDSGKRLIATVAALGNKKRIDPALSFAASNRAVVVPAEQLDADPFLVGVLNGVVNLADGSFHPHNRKQLVTRRLAVSYDANATAPNFEKFLAEVQPEPEMRAFLQRLSGYALTGETRDHVLPFHYGTGANGKGTFLEQTILRMAGSYGAKLTDSLVYASERSAPPHLELANLCGRRYALGEENSSGGKINESLLKAITGGDRVKGRFHYGNFKEYFPTYKIALVGNHKPRIDGTDDGIWRRFLLVDWPVQIPEQLRDTKLKDKLAAEMPGILNWCIAGAREWAETGLNPPESCRVATAAFREKSDALSEFVAECFVADADGYSTKAEVFTAYKGWANQQGIAHPMSKRALGFQLINRGWQEQNQSHENCRCWLGWRLTTPFQP